jgi:hypothetical protein
VRLLKNNNLFKNIVAKTDRTKHEFGTFHNQEEVFVEPPFARRGDNLSINYRGLLHNSGAESIYLHYGFDHWQNSQTIQMNRMYDGLFRSEIRAQGSQEVNFCFKDSANNWDNNNGCNWNVQLQ